MKKERLEWKTETYKQYWSLEDDGDEIMFSVTVGEDDGKRFYDLSLMFGIHGYEAPNLELRDLSIEELENLVGVLNNLIDKAKKAAVYDVDIL